jgi:hypothetical protein
MLYSARTRKQVSSRFSSRNEVINKSFCPVVPEWTKTLTKWPRGAVYTTRTESGTPNVNFFDHGVLTGTGQVDEAAGLCQRKNPIMRPITIPAIRAITKRITISRSIDNTFFFSCFKVFKLLRYRNYPAENGRIQLHISGILKSDQKTNFLYIFRGNSQ